MIRKYSELCINIFQKQTDLDEQDYTPKKYQDLYTAPAHMSIHVHIFVIG